MDRLPGILKAYLEVTLKSTTLPNLTPLLTVPVNQMLAIHVTPDNHQRKIDLRFCQASDYRVLERAEYHLQAGTQAPQVLTTPSDPNWGILEQFDSINFGGGFDIKASYLAIMRICEPGATVARTAVELGLPGTDPHNPYETTLINL